MAYTAPNIKDRVAVGDDLYTITEVDGKVKLVPSPTEVSEPGTEINKAFLQPLCDELEAAWAKLLSLAKVATSGSYDDLIGIPSNLLVYNITSASYSANKYSIPLPRSRYIYWLDGSTYYDETLEGYGISSGTVIKNDAKILSHNMVYDSNRKYYVGGVMKYDQYMYHAAIGSSSTSTFKVALISNGSLMFGQGYSSLYKFIGTLYLMPV